MMNSIELLEKYPEVTNVINDWYIKKLMESFKESPDVPDDFKKMLLEQRLEKNNISKLIDASSRHLFDLFDEQDVYIQINVNYREKNFSYSINESVIAGNWNTRKAAEDLAVYQAFDLLNKKLIKDEKNITTSL